MELKEKCRQGVFKHYISLGHSCYVAMDLEELGLRDATYPLDWVNSPFGAAERAIKTRFDTFLEYDNLYQSKRTPTVYKNRDYMIAFPRDFDAYAKLSKQIGGVINKYSRRIERFYESIAEPTLFFRYSENNEEMIELASRYDEFMGLLKQYNQENELVIIYHDDIDEAIAEKVPNSYRVYKDEGDVVTHHPLIQNNILFDLLNTADFSLREKT